MQVQLIQSNCLLSGNYFHRLWQKSVCLWPKLPVSCFCSGKENLNVLSFHTLCWLVSLAKASVPALCAVCKRRWESVVQSGKPSQLMCSLSQELEWVSLFLQLLEMLCLWSFLQVLDFFFRLCSDFSFMEPVSLAKSTSMYIRNLLFYRGPFIRGTWWISFYFILSWCLCRYAVYL